MEGFLICSGTLAIIVGLLAVIEGTLGCLGSMWRKKDRTMFSTLNAAELTGHESFPGCLGLD